MRRGGERRRTASGKGTGASSVAEMAPRRGQGKDQKGGRGEGVLT